MSCWSLFPSAYISERIKREGEREKTQKKRVLVVDEWTCVFVSHLPHFLGGREKAIVDDAIYFKVCWKSFQYEFYKWETIESEKFLTIESRLKDLKRTLKLWVAFHGFYVFIAYFEMRDSAGEWG